MQVKTVDYRTSDAGEALTESLLNTGFAVLENHPISAQRLEEIYTAWGRFFASDAKHDFLRDFIMSIRGAECLLSWKRLPGLSMVIYRRLALSCWAGWIDIWMQPADRN